MSKAIFVVAFPPETSLPPMEAQSGTQLHYTEGGVLRGGYSVVGQVPQAPTCLVLVEASPAAIAAMTNDGRWLFVEEVVDAEGP